MEKINENIFAIPVPMDAEEIGKQELIDGWFELFYTTLNDIDFHYNRVSFDFDILGTITATECSFDCSELVEEMKINGVFIYESVDYLISKIESTTGYIFNDETKLLIIKKK